MERGGLPIFKVRAIGIIIFGVALIFLLGIRGIQEYTSTSPESSPEATGSIISVNSVALFDAYQKDAAVADTKYRGRLLEVTGEVIFSSDLLGLAGKYYIILSSGDPFQSFGVLQSFGVRFIFDEYDQRVRDVKKHDTVKIRGICLGFQTDVILEKSTLVD